MLPFIVYLNLPFFLQIDLPATPARWTVPAVSSSEQHLVALVLRTSFGHPILCGTRFCRGILLRITIQQDCLNPILCDERM